MHIRTPYLLFVLLYTLNSFSMAPEAHPAIAYIRETIIKSAQLWRPASPQQEKHVVENINEGMRVRAASTAALILQPKAAKEAVIALSDILYEALLKMENSIIEFEIGFTLEPIAKGDIEISAEKKNELEKVACDYAQRLITGGDQAAQRLVERVIYQHLVKKEIENHPLVIAKKNEDLKAASRAIACLITKPESPQAAQLLVENMIHDQLIKQSNEKFTAVTERAKLLSADIVSAMSSEGLKNTITSLLVHHLIAKEQVTTLSLIKQFNEQESKDYNYKQATLNLLNWGFSLGVSALAGSAASPSGFIFQFAIDVLAQLCGYKAKSLN